MCADATQVNYEELAKIMRQFECEAESIAELEGMLRREVDALCSREWRGRASQSFQREMHGRALPGLSRLSQALLEASRTTGQIEKIYREHEEEAAGLFRGQQDGSASRAGRIGRPGAAAQPGPGGQPASRTQGEFKLDGYRYDPLNNKNGLDVGLKIKYGVDNAVYERKGDDGFDIFGGGGGFEFGLGDKGFDAGVYGEGYLVKGDVDGVLGNDRLGVTGGVGTNLVGAEAFAGIRHNSIGASIGGKLATVDGKVGLNIAGVNVNLIGEVGLKAELGFSIGAKTQIKAPFFSLGLSFGKAEAR